MNMIEAVQSCLKNYVGFSGRARRSEYWYWVLATIIIAVILAIIEAVLGLSTEGDGPLSNLFNLAIFLPGLAVSFRRLHDTGRSGWWIGGFYLGLLIFGIIIALIIGVDYASGDFDSFDGFGFILIILILAVFAYAIMLLVFMCQDSHDGPNKYGPNPKNVGNFDIFN